MKKKTWGLAMTSVILTSLVLSGCGAGSTGTGASAAPSSGSGTAVPGKKTTIEFWAAAITPEREAFWKSVTTDFMAKNPDITINYLGVPGDLSAYNQKVNVALSAGQAPDLINNFTSDLVGRGVLEPLDDYIAKWSGKDKITPGAIASIKAADPKGGKIYGLPYGVQPWIMWYRPDWLKEANLPEPRTWDQFLDDAKKLTDKSKGKFGYGIRGGAGSANTLEMLMYSYSGITNYFTKDGKATINDPLHVEFLDKYLGGYNVYTPEDDLGKGWTELAASFQSGKVGMIFHNLGSASAHEKAFTNDLSKFSAAAFPKSVKGYNVHPGVTPTSMLMLKSSKNKDAVWKFMTYFVENHNGAYGKLYGEIPPNTAAMKEDWIQKIPYMKTGADLMASTETKFTDNPVYLPNYSNIQLNMEPMIQKVMAKKINAIELLDEWAKQLETAKADFDAANKGK
ncbi:ABC transporter substrate-binding protein [Paenibacillus whitsoniae]|uniref:ABC transporter substrate-binding protein n=1 Tax=Paenibacillus whitsoniae TaxID=2496558 RepID=UPI0013E05A34|nr:sugar ABC transporter substrate-binding protein [Paenibacillus whitsoniae]